MSYTQEHFQRYAQMSSINEEQYKNILNEKLMDCFVLKLLIQIENKIGAMLVLASELSGNILCIYSIFGSSPTIRRLQPFEKVSSFMNNILKAHKEGGTELAISERLGRTIYRTLTPENILPNVETIRKKDFSQIKDLIIQGIIKETKLTNIQVEIESEKINSIQFFKKNILYDIFPEVRNPFEIQETITQTNQTTAASKNSLSIQKTRVELAIEEIIKNYKEVVKCQTVVSPVSGLTFEELTLGQKLLFLLPFKTPEDRSRARRLGAVNSLGQNQPIVGEFVKLVMAENEYHIFAKGPGNVLLRAFEERPVRLAFPKDTGEKLEEKTIKAALVVAGAFVVLILTLLYFYFK